MIKLNLGRNCLKIIIRKYGIKEIFIPYYSCNTMWKAIKEENCKIKFYHIDKNFMPAKEFEGNDYVLYINYFGLFEKNVKKLCKKYKNIIVDNTQSFYSKPNGIASFNSLRKFFPVQNGAYLYGIENIRQDFPNDELNLKIANFNSDYEIFKENELKLNKENIKKISKNVEKIMNNFDFEKDKKLRISLYKKYSEIFDKYNLIKLPNLENNIPYCYPFCTNDTKIYELLNKNNISILKLWDKIPITFTKDKNLHNVGAFPLDNPELAGMILKLGKELKG